MNFAYTILYVRNVEGAVEFYEKAFGLTRRFIGEDKNYGEMETGGTTLSFCDIEFAQSSFKFEFADSDLAKAPARFEVGFTTDDVAAAFEQAVKAGATVVTAPAQKPWGQTVAYVRDLNGILVELCTPIQP